MNRLLAVHLGTPPKEFGWSFVNGSGALHRNRGLTPHTFAATVTSANYVSLMTTTSAITYH